MPDLPNTPQSNVEEYLAPIAGQSGNPPAIPGSRVEQYLAKILENHGRAIPTKTSDLVNDTGYQTYDEVIAAIRAELAGIVQVEWKVVQTLPSFGEMGVIYLIQNGGTGANVYDEYLWISVTSSFEKIGTTDVDLSGYAKTTDVNVALSMKQDKATGKGLSTNDYTTEEKTKLANIETGAQVNPGPATSSANGLMTGEDKAKLDSVSLPVTLSNQPIASFQSGAAGRPLRVTVNIEPQQAAGTSSPSNVRPITGWTGASVCRTSENLLPPGESGSGIVDEVTISSDGAGTYRLTGGPISDARSRKFFFPTIVLPTDDCYLHIGNSSANVQIACVLGNDDSDIGIITPALISVNRIFKITAPAGSKLKWIGFYFNSVSNVGDMTVSPMIMRSDSPTAFKPCSLQNIAVSFPSSAGTVYGGTLDVARGLLTVTHMLYSFTGNEPVSEFWAEGGYFSMLIPHLFIWGNTIVSSHYHYEQFDSWPSWSSVPSDYFIGAYSSSSGNTNLLRIKDSALAASDSSEFSTKIQSYYRNQAANGTPVQCVLEVNPITYQLTPRQIVSLAGTNNVFADCGPVTVTHWPGTGTPVEPVEDGAEIAWKKGILDRIAALEGGS